MKATTCDEDEKQSPQQTRDCLSNIRNLAFNWTCETYEKFKTKRESSYAEIPSMESICGFLRWIKMINSRWPIDHPISHRFTSMYTQIESLMGRQGQVRGYKLHDRVASVELPKNLTSLGIRSALNKIMWERRDGDGRENGRMRVNIDFHSIGCVFAYILFESTRTKQRKITLANNTVKWRNIAIFSFNIYAWQLPIPIRRSFGPNRKNDSHRTHSSNRNKSTENITHTHRHFQ